VTERRYFIETFGCQMNVNDSEKVAGLLEAEGFAAAASADDADFVFVNTCAVREKAAEKLYSSLGRLRRAGARERRIGVGGCVAQLQGREVLARAPGIDLLVGTHNISRVPELLRRADGTGPVVDLDRRADAFDVPPALVAHRNPVRAYVTAIEGCNHVCSFCVVPRTRGPEVCRGVDEIAAEIEQLVERGFPEVMLLGQTVNAYRHGEHDFVALLERVDRIHGLRRLRFTTSHPSHVDRRLARAFARLPRLCPYLHLPVQSGSDPILASMRRGYTAGGYGEAIAMLREECPGLALTSDVIVGYPGETEADFEATLDLVARSRFDGLFAFKYSPRPGTAALRLRDDVGEEEKTRRLRVLNELQQRWQAELNGRRIGRVEEVLFESAPESHRLSGRTRDFRIVHSDGGEQAVGTLCRVEITGAGPNSLRGRILH
jgi:tRNA-2-methylthio-N6-dimethylallyladenosine synthase